MADDNTLIELTAGIVSAYVGKNAIAPSGITALVRDVHAALTAATRPAALEAPAPEPAVPVRRSVTPDHIVCLECGKHFKSLKRHLSTDHQLEPGDYRAKWGLRPDYPMVAPSYSEKRSEMAKTHGLGRRSEPKKAAKRPPTKR